MRLLIGVTDYEWFQLHASKAVVEEVNFWRPSPEVGFRALQPGEPFLFKLHSPRNFIAGRGFFAKQVDQIAREHLGLSFAYRAEPKNSARGNAVSLVIEISRRHLKQGPQL